MYKLDLFDKCVNTGQLLGLRRDGGRLYIEVLEASAASHVAPRYPLSGEAPRVYGDEAKTDADYRRVWIEWAASLLGWSRPGLTTHAVAANAAFRESSARAWIRSHWREVPTGHRQVGG